MSGSNESVLAMCQAWEQMNIVRARDGVPYCFDGRKSDVSQECWDLVMNNLNEAVKAETGTGCWLNPCLYK